MNYPKRLVHMRHAESLVQKSRETARSISDREMPITKEGKALVERTGILAYERFGAFNCLIHSTFLRSQQSAMALIAPYSKQELSRLIMRMDERLNERNMGGAFGMTNEEIFARFPDWVKDREGIGEFRMLYPEGDSLYEVRERMKGLLAELFEEFPDGDILLSGHWGTSLALRSILESLDESEVLQAMVSEHPANCSFLVYEFDPGLGRLTLREKNLLLC